MFGAEHEDYKYHSLSLKKDRTLLERKEDATLYAELKKKQEESKQSGEE